MRRYAMLMLVLSALFPSHAQARELAGVRLDESVVLPGEAEILKLNGAAIRSKLLIKVYIAALYVPETSTNASSILASPSAKRMLMHMLYSEVEKEKQTQAWREGFENNLSSAELTAMKPRLDKFVNLFTTMRKNDVALIDYVPGIGTRVSIRGEEKGIVEGADFYRAVLSVWIGEEPATDDLKQGLLGLE